MDHVLILLVFTNAVSTRTLELPHLLIVFIVLIVLVNNVLP